jgi:hypothetical protein
VSTRRALFFVAIVGGAVLAAVGVVSASTPGTGDPPAQREPTSSQVTWVASAGTTARQGTPVKERLTPSERRALRIVSVKAVGVEKVGLTVTVTFAGNLERALGRGHLENGLVAIVLRPKDPGFDTADLATRGAGAIGKTIRKTQSSDVGVVRNGRKLTFFVGGPGAENVGQIEVKAFATFPPVRAGRPAFPAPTAEFWQGVEEDIAHDEAAVQVSADTPCRDLLFMQRNVEGLLEKAAQRDRQLRELKRDIEKAIPELEDDLLRQHFVHAATTLLNIATSIATPIAALAPGGAGAGLAAHAFGLKLTQTVREEKQILRDAIRSLKLDVRLVDAVIPLNQKLIGNLNQLKGKIEVFISVNCSISEDDTWTHNPPLGKSNVCVNVRTKLAAGTFTVTLTGPGGFKAESPGRTPLVNGAGQFIATITRAGEFTKTIEVYDDMNVLTATVTKTFVVANPPTDGPATTPPCPKPTE